MELTKNFRIFLKPFFIGASILIIASLLFITGYIFVEYKQYLQAYQKNQHIELNAIQQKAQEITNTLKELLQLTRNRIGASQGDSTRILNILNSALRLYEPYELPKIQNFSYYKLSRPQIIINRFGIVPFEYKQLAQVTEAEPLITFNKGVIKGTISVFNEKSNIEGFLEIEINPSDFKTALENFQTLTFTSLPSSQNKNHYSLEIDSLTLHAKSPYNFWKFSFLSKNYYMFFFFILFSYLLYLLLALFTSIKI